MARVSNFWLCVIFLLIANGTAFAQCTVQANFGYSVACQGNATHFTDSSIFNSGNSITSWTWDFGDGSNANIANPSHNYAATGNYTVTLSVTTIQGCTDTEIEQIIVNSNPSAAFTLNPNPVTCNDEYINFTDNSVGTSLAYFWTFGDGTTSTAQNPQHAVPPMLNSCGGFSYNTLLMVTDINGCSAFSSQNVIVQPRPTADIVSASQHICAIFVNGIYEAEHTIFNMSSAPCLQSYVIDWGDGTPLESESIDSISFSHLYNTYGFFSLALYGISNGGACSTIVFRDTVLIEITPTAGIIGPSASWINGCAPFTTYFILNSTVTPTTSQTVIWGGMDTVSLPNTYMKGDTVWHTFIVSGCDSMGVMTPYNIVLNAVNLCGSSITTWGNYTVHRSPIASFNIPDTICKNDFVTFQNTTNRNLCGGWTLTQFNWKIYKNGSLVINSNSLVADANPTLPNMNFAFSDTGTYNIILTATDNGSYGCGSSQYSKTVYVQGTYSNFWSDTVCLGNPTFFYDSSYSVNGTLTSWHWDFGDGFQSTDTNAIHTFSTSGFHNVTLITFDSNNCSDTITKPVYVSPYPVSDFTFDTVCVGTPTNFNDLSFTTAIDSIIFWQWYFGDGDSSFLQNPSHIYADSGFYNTALIVSTTFSCPDTITQIVYVSPFPNADFISNTACLGFPTTFTDISTTAAIDSIILWSWDFGDGTTANDTNPVHTFSTSGFQDVTLIVNSSIGCSDTIIKQVYVSPIPTAYFIFDTVCLGYPVHFIDSSFTTGLDTITGWLWNFGDSTGSFLQSPDHLYNDTGYFSVSLLVSTDNGCIDSITQIIYVNPYPIIDFSSNQVCLGGTTQFTDLTTTSPIDHIVSWNWDFGGGATSNLQNPTYIFSTSGYHSVTLHTISAVGCEDEVTHNAYVSPFPVANFSAPPACIGNVNTFINQSTTSGIHPINQWYWTFGDGTTAIIQSPVHTYGDTGIYNISLAVTTSLGCKSDTIHKTTYVSPYPVANFAADTVCLTHATSFTNLSNTIANDSIVTWQWSFGDGNISNQQNPQHIYADSGVFNVSLIAISSIGCSDTIIKSIYVKPLPFPDFSAPAVCLGSPTIFTDLSSNSVLDVINGWTWFFDDGNTSSVQNPNHLYSDSGMYNVTLIVFTDIGCSDSITKNVYVSPIPTAQFSIDSVCLGIGSDVNESSFTPAQDSIISWQWLFGNGNNSNIQNPLYTYSDTGQFNVSLIVLTSIGCTDTVSHITYISPYPVADFIADTACFGNPTAFHDFSTTDAIDSIILWSWDFGDGSNSILQNPIHSYSDTGFFDVTLIVTSNIGCSDTLEKNIYVKPLPTSEFTATSSCLGLPATFTDLSYSSAVDTINSWLWLFGDGFSSNIQNPTHIYSDTGYYNVTLTVFSSIGCFDSISHIVYVSSGPIPDFISDTVCLGSATTFTDISYTLANDSIAFWNWNFGDGITSNIQNPTHQYADTGFVNVTLIVSTTIGCSDSLHQSIYVSPHPTSDFFADTACLGFSTLFSDSSATSAIDSIISWNWNFGDGSFSSLQNPQHIYADSGNFNVTLIVSSTFDCTDTITRIVYVNSPPVAGYSATTECLGNTTIFTDLSIASVHDYITSWTWDFGDGNTSSIQNPTHEYADSGFYSVSLIVTSWLGCSDTTVLNVYVSPYPYAGFYSDTVCLVNLTTFTDISYTLANDNITGWEWDFGDGNNSLQQNPSHNYADTGFFNVTLIVTTIIGCTDTISHTAYVSTFPTADFEADTACLTWPTSFTDLSFTPAIDSIISWSWDFGDGYFSNLQNPQHTYADSGYFMVTLIISSTFGCSDTIYDSIYVRPLPTPDFLAYYVCIGSSTIYTDLSYSSSVDTIFSWTWQFGDGNISNLQNPSHLFADTGLYQTVLIVSSSIGCSDSIIKDVYVSPFPIADFSFDTICIGNETHFTDLSYTHANDSIISWNWNFGDNSHDTIPSPVHIYNDTGYFSVSLVITTSIGCSDSVFKNVFVSPSPVADFAADSACIGFETTFSDLSHSLAFDSIISWNWHFGDGIVSTLQNPIHIYPDTGNYTVSLVCHSQIGCSDSVSKIVYVKPLPVPNFNALPACLGESTQFSDLSFTSPNDIITGWLWQFESTNSSIQNPLYIFSDTGVFNVTLIAYSLLGCSDSISKDVYVSPYPIADFSDDTVCMGYVTTFNDLSTLLNSDSITSWVWDFGDGNSSLLPNPQHIYSDSGFYHVALIVTTSIGCSDTITRDVYVSPSPIADFDADNVCLNNPTIFNDLSYTLAIDTIQSWLWDFGDGNTSNLQNPQHTYSDTGFYTVTLTIESTIGCPNTIVKSVYVSPYPVAGFIADTVCLGNSTSFADLSYTVAVDSIISWVWNFGDGNSSNTQNTTHIYSDSGHFNVQQIITTIIGCSDSVIHTVYVSPYPVADFIADTVCLGAATTFNDLSYTDAIDSITGWDWDFGDGSTSTLQNPTHTYSTAGNFNVTLIIYSSIGCEDTIIRTVYVSPLPIAGFSADTVCIGSITTFTDLSTTAAVDSIDFWAWDFGDGQISSLQNPTNLYADTGIFTVSLNISTTLGCTDTIIHNIYISPMPHAAFTADTVCIGNITTYIDLSYTVAQDTINYWDWQFGDGNISNLQNPTNIYADTGLYNVIFTVASSIGCLDSTAMVIYVSPYPHADFIADTACLGAQTTFTDLSYTIATDSLSEWTWNFGDGDTSDFQSPVHAYSTSGVYSVSLIVYSGIGCSDTIIKDVYVSPPPAVLFSADTGCRGFNTTFTDLTTVDSPDSIIIWTWDFGDGVTSNLQNPQHLYSDSGYYTVSLSIVSLLGCSNADTINVYIKPLPSAVFEALPVCTGSSSLFNDLSTTAINDSLFSWNWDFGDGNNSNIQNPSHQYADSGTYNVMLIVSGYMGCFDTVTTNVHVIPLPIADFDAPYVCFGNDVICTDLTDSLGYDITNWHWDFGDGDTSILQNPVHNYLLPGNYLITLTVYNEFNCYDTISHLVHVYDIPVPNFTFNNVCLNENTIFNDSSSVVSNPIVSWQWNFDDGDTSTTQNPVHLYAAFGAYNVSLTVIDSVGCTDSIFKQIEVYPLPVAAFIADSICNGDTAVFSDISSTFSGSIVSWQWNFGDGSGTSTIQNPTYLYNNVSVITDFDVSFIVSNSYGCYDTINQLLHINPLPIAQFEADTACFGNPTQFNDLSYSNGGSINSWDWDFGVGSGSDTVSNPTYIYNNTGFFDVSLSVNDEKGCSQSITQTVLVDSLPIPSFDWCQVCMVGQLLPVTFINTSQGNGSTITNNYWTFGDGQTSTLNDSVTNNYSAAGSYNVTLVTTNDRGCSDSITNAITLHSGLSVNFTFNVNCFNVSFNAYSSNATSLIEWEWNFGDGSFSTQHDSAQHTYFQPGTYLITLTVYDSLPCMNIVCEYIVSNYIYVYPQPIAEFSASNVLVGMATDFTDLSSAPQSSIVSWDWDFGDGTTSTFQNPIHNYLQYGVYNVTLTITNSYGCSMTVTHQVIVYPALIASFDSAVICAQAPLTFNNTSQILLPGIPVTWYWEFGDGLTSSDSLPTHTYNLPGIYTAMLIVSMSSTVADTAYQQITVIDSPIADFTFTEVCWGDTLTTLHDNTFSTQPIVQWQWNLGDGTTSNQPNVNHNYAQYGTYNVLLVVENTFGCIDSINKDVKVFDIPVVSLNVSPNFGCLPLTVSFNDLSTVNDASLINWLWDFGDGLGSVGYPYIDHTYNFDGLYSITLTVVSDKGCTNSITIPDYVQVYPVPDADFSFSPSTPFSIDMVQFDNISTGSNSWLWDFGDGNNSILYNPHHIFAEGYFTIALVAYNQYNCTDTAYREIYVRPTSTIYIPNAFSPLNNDELNDFFMVSGTNLYNFEMRIFNRYGQQIFYSDDVNKGWDGRFQGNIVPLGVYIWKLWYRDAYGYKQELYGTVSVIY